MTVSTSARSECFATVIGSCVARRESISTATTALASSSIARVREPRPGPISSAISADVRPAVRTIFRQTFPSCTKFCPRDFDGLRSREAASSRISAAPKRLMQKFQRYVRHSQIEQRQAPLHPHYVRPPSLGQYWQSARAY